MHTAKNQANLIKCDRYLPKEADSRRWQALHSKLLELDAVSSQHFDEAQAAYVAAQANLQAAVAKRDMLLLKESRCEVRAPIDGTVRLIYRQPGTYVASGTSLALVGDYNELYFSHQISDDKAQRLQVGQEAEFIFPGREFKNLDWTHGGMEAEHAFHGVLTGIAPPLEVPGAARTLLWRIDNPLGLLTPQTYGTAFLKMAQGTEALCVPLSALTDKTRQAVFVYHDGKLERRAVVTGRDDGDYVEILGGVEPGEIVIVFGTENLQDGLKAEVKAGRITDIYVKTGSHVHEGQLIAHMEQPEQSADTRMAQYGTGLAANDRDVQSRVYQYDAKRQQQTANEDIYCEYDGIVDEVMASKGQILSAGAPICTVRLTEERKDLSGIFYIPVDKGKRVAPGMTIQLAPNGVDVSQTGSLLGVVESVSQYPISSAGVEKGLGNAQLAQYVLSKDGGAAVEVKFSLVKDASSESGYLWTSVVGIHAPITPGSYCTGAVVIERQMPIEKVFYKISQWLRSR